MDHRAAIRSLCIALLSLISFHGNAALTLEFVWPELNRGDISRAEADWTQVRFNGHTDPEASLTLNGRAVRVWPTGAFAGLLDNLEAGENTFTFEARHGDEVARRTLRVIRAARPTPLPPHPIRIVDGTVEPSDMRIVAQGDELVVSFAGSPGGQASATLSDGTRIPVTESTTRPGWYRGTHRVEGGEGWSDATISVRLAGGAEAVEAVCPGRIWNLDVDHPPVLEVEAPDRTYAPLYPDRSESERLADLPPGTHLTVWGREGSHWRVRLAPDVFAWVPVGSAREQFVQELADGTPPPHGALETLDARIRPRSANLDLHFSDRIPFRVVQQDSGTFQMIFYGLTEERTRPPSELPEGSMVESIEWQREAEQVHTLTMTLARPVWGWDAQWEGNTLQLSVISSPIFAPPPASPLEGLRIAIDPGHGGDDSGALGSTGLAESEVNLAMARLVTEGLRERGAEVTLLRTDDSRIGLNERVRAAATLEADLFISIHSNSVGETTDPFSREGVAVYHSHPSCQDLAESLRAHLTALDGIVDAGVYQSNLRVTRPSRCPSTLVELLYMSNPGDEARLLDDGWRERIAGAIVEGVATWADERRTHTFLNEDDLPEESPLSTPE